MARIVVEGLTMEQATAIAEFMVDDNAQDAEQFMDERKLAIPEPDTDRKDGYIEIKGSTVLLYFKTPETVLNYHI